MMINGLHWCGAAVVAVAIHAAGMWWICRPGSSRHAAFDRAGEAIVVTFSEFAVSSIPTGQNAEAESGRAFSGMGESLRRGVDPRRAPREIPKTPPVQPETIDLKRYTTNDSIEASPPPEEADVVTAEAETNALDTSADLAVSKTQFPSTVNLGEDATTATLDSFVAAASSDASANRQTSDYLKAITSRLQQNMRYPEPAYAAGQEGEVVLRFVINRRGRVQSVKLESSSGISLLDQEAEQIVERSDPFPAMPTTISARYMEVRVTASFDLDVETIDWEVPIIELE